MIPIGTRCFIAGERMTKIKRESQKWEKDVGTEVILIWMCEERTPWDQEMIGKNGLGGAKTVSGI